MLSIVASEDGASLRGRWFRLLWSQSLAGQPFRPVVRLVGAGGSEEHALSAAALGRGAWTWRAPHDLERLEVLAPVDRADALRIDAVERVSAARVILQVLRRRPPLLVHFLRWPVSERARCVAAHEAFDLAPLDAFADHARARRRSLEPASLDAPLIAEAAAGPRLGFVVAVAAANQITPLRRTLAAFAAQHDEGFRLVVLAPAALASSVGEGGLGDRLEVVIADGAEGVEQAARTGADYVARLLPGDEPAPEAVLSLRAFLARRPDLDVLYSDSAVRSSAGALSVQLKPDWSPLFRQGLGYVGRPCLVRASLINPEASWGDLPALVASRRGDAAVGHLKRVLVTLAGEAAGVRVPTQRRHAEERAQLASRSTHDRGASFETPAARAPQDDDVGRFVPSRQDQRASRLPSRSEAGRTPHATLVVPTRDRADLLRRLYDSIDERMPAGGHDLVVVDNGSTEEDALAYLAEIEERPDVQVLRQPGPFNFSSLVNAGAAAARGPVLVLLNNDCEILQPDWLERMAALASEPGIGAVGAKLLYADGSLQHAGVGLGLGGEAGHRDRRMPGDHPGHLGRLTVPHEVAAVTGACLAVRLDLFREVGGFDETLPVAFNDIDFCLRLLRSGHRNVLDPGAVLRHAESASRGRDQEKERRARFLAEAALFRERWGDLILDDPYSHPMLSTFRFRDLLG